MFGSSGVPSAPCQEKSGAGIRLRSGVFPASVFGCLAVLSAWWLPAGTAQATPPSSYPPALGCAVTGTPGDGGTWVQGMGFRAGSVVRISVAGHGARAVADPAGSFEAWAPGRPPAAGAALTATGPGCTAHGLLGSNPLPSPGKSPPPGSRPEPAPPGAPQAVAIPAVPLSHVPSQLFLGLAGAVLLAGAALTGLTGRWGHRAEGRPGSGASVSGTGPITPDNA